MERVDGGWIITSPDVLLMQETKMSQDQFPEEHYERLGYESVHCGEGRWNGVAILSKVGLEDPVSGLLMAPKRTPRRE